MPLRHISLAVTLAAVTVACATNPVTGRRELALMSEAQEIELGRQTDAEIRKTMGIYNDPELQQGRAVVEHVVGRESPVAHLLGRLGPGGELLAALVGGRLRVVACGRRSPGIEALARPIRPLRGKIGKLHLDELGELLEVRAADRLRLIE